MMCLQSELWAPLIAQLSTHDPHWVALHNRLHRHRHSWSGSWADQEVRVQLTGALAQTELCFSVVLSLGDALIMLDLPDECLEVIGVLQPPELNTLSGSMTLELALLDLLEPLEQLAGQPLRVLDSSAANVAGHDASSFVVDLHLQVQLSQRSPMNVSLRLSAPAAIRLAELFEYHATPVVQPLPALLLPLAVDAGEAALSLAELRSLNPGDVVMLDRWPHGQARLMLSHRLQAHVKWDGDTLTLLEELNATHFFKEHAMTEAADPLRQNDTLDRALDELPLKLVCQIGSVELTLAQLRALGVGSLMQLTSPIYDGVDLMVNGRKIGQGQLVKIGDGMGVRLLSFTTP